MGKRAMWRHPRWERYMTRVDLDFKTDPWWCYEYLECVDTGSYCPHDDTHTLITWDIYQHAKVVDFWDPNGMFDEFYWQNRAPDPTHFAIVKVIGGCVQDRDLAHGTRVRSAYLESWMPGRMFKDIAEECGFDWRSTPNFQRQKF